MDNYILITGATSGLGGVTASILAEEYLLILQGRDLSKLELMRDTLPNSSKHLIFRYDLSLIDNLSEDFTIFLRQNNACVTSYIHYAGVWEVAPIRLVTSKSTLKSFTINYFSALDIMHVLLKKEFKVHLKSVLFISSVSAHCGGGKGLASYAPSKCSLESYTKVAAVELAPNTRVNCLALGKVPTESNLSAQLNDDYFTSLQKHHLLGFGEPKDVGEFASFLISDKAKWATGQIILLDGGYSVNLI